MQLSKNFTYAEATHSEKALALNILNIPSSEMLQVLKHTAQRMEYVRAALGNKPITVSSWYRCASLNAAVQGTKNSQHMIGEAVDFTCPAFGSPLQIVQHLSQLADILDYDQIILEHTWVHISFKSDPTMKNRNEVLTWLPSEKRYAKGITTKEGLPV